MKNIIIVCTTLLFFGCTDDLSPVVDFTKVENPTLSESSVVGQPNSSSVWLDGIQRNMAFVYNEILILAELGSDNYVNTQTFFNQFLDILELQPADPDLRDCTREIARLREMALFGLETVGPADEEYSADIEAEYNFYLGLSYMYAGMYFPALPQEEGGGAVSANQNYLDALTAINTAIALRDGETEYLMAKARIHYYLGEKAEAVDAANQALAIDASFDNTVGFDEKELAGTPNGTDPGNVFEDALYQRGTFDDLQPLPSLDFLDPKYSFVDPDIDAEVHYLKAEEALLILAEANLSDGNVAMTQENLTALLEIIAGREVRNIDDSVEGRIQVEPGVRPDTTSVVVNGREGLVLYRQGGNVDVPSVSGTSLTADEIAGLSADDAGLELLYRTRQEVFIAEGLRFVDMGLKLIIDENEVLQSDNITEGDLGTVPLIPSFIDAVKGDIDAISYDATTGVATTTVDITAILVANKTAPEVLPFH